MICEDCGDTKTCQHCSGSGIDPNGLPHHTCPICNGSGICPYCKPAPPPRRRPETSELYNYPRYGYDGDRKSAYFDDLDVDLCPRCQDQDIFPGDRVCVGCLAEINANDFS